MLSRTCPFRALLPTRRWVGAAVMALACLVPAEAVARAVAGAPADAARSNRRVLVLNSYHIGYTWTDQTLRGMRDVFAESGLDIEYSTHFMDMKRVSAREAHFAHWTSLLRDAYASTRFDAIMVCDNDALDFVTRVRDELFPGVPVVFVGINDFTPDMLQGRHDITGVVEDADYLETVKLGLRLRPRADTVVVVSDNTTTGLVQRAEFQRAAKDIPARVAVRHLSLGDTTIDELADALARLPQTAVVLLLNSATDKNGVSYSLERSVDLLTRRCPVPALVVADSRVGWGSLGGLVTSGYTQGRAGARMVVAILQGTDVRSIPVTLKSPNLYTFDYAAMRRWGLSARDVPQGSVILNQPLSIFDQYRAEVVAAGVVLFVAVMFVIALALEVLRRRRVEVSLQKSEAALSGVLNSVPEAIFWKDRHSVYQGCNRGFSEAVGLSSPEEIVGKTDDDLPWERGKAASVRAEDAEILASSRSIRCEEPLRRADGTEIWIDKRKMPLADEAGEPSGVLGIYDDITERRQAEVEKSRLREQLQQAMKMEAVGRLAGGVAHDFNNLLTAISGNLELALSDLDESNPVARYLEEAHTAAESAAGVTRQLLAFSRKQLIEPRVVNLNDLVSGLQKMLVRLIGEDVELRSALREGVGAVKVDPGEIEQVLVNLAVNARDAMPDGGTLVLETENVDLDEAFCRRHPPLAPGPHVMLAVTDSGVGMTDEVKSHLFEPFFTTKAKGRGTGLGLATIFGTVQQAGGTITVYSEVGLGTTFKVYLPRVEGVPSSLARTASSRDLPSGSETVLLVEDDAGVRTLAVTILERLGYRVLVAANAAEALAMGAGCREPIDLLMTDVVLPGMNGRDLSEQVVAQHPEAKVLFTSGYTENVIAHHGVVEENLNFIGKPYSMQALAAKLREVLASQGGRPPALDRTR